MRTFKSLICLVAWIPFARREGKVLVYFIGSLVISISLLNLEMDNLSSNIST